MDFSPVLWLRAPLNAGFFAFRQWLGWRRGIPEWVGQPWRSALAHWPPEKRERLAMLAEEYRNTYRLSDLDSVLHGRQWVKNLYVLDLLIQTLGPHIRAGTQPNPSHPSPVRILDIGSADWEYVFAMHRFFRNAFPSGFELSGVEVDGHGIYPDGYSRADYTAAYIRCLNAGNVKIHYGDVTRMDFPPQDVVTCFFPFILPYQILAWGLPLKLLQPRLLLSRQASWIRPGGLWYLVCHAVEEREPMRKLLGEFQNFQWVAEGPARSGFEDNPSSYDERWYWVFRKDPEVGQPR